MADPVVVAQRRADALKQFDVEAKKLSENLDITVPEPVPHEINRDGELRKVYDLERVVKFLHDVNEAMAPPRVAELVSEGMPCKPENAAPIDSVVDSPPIDPRVPSPDADGPKRGKSPKK